jgi:hypothetical protein
LFFRLQKTKDELSQQIYRKLTNLNLANIASTSKMSLNLINKNDYSETDLDEIEQQFIKLALREEIIQFELTTQSLHQLIILL